MIPVQVLIQKMQGRCRLKKPAKPIARPFAMVSETWAASWPEFIVF